MIDQLGGNAVTGIHNNVLWMSNSLSNDYRGLIEYGLRAILIEREPTGTPPLHSRALMVLPELPNPRLIEGRRDEPLSTISWFRPCGLIASEFL
ncbi:hypothetical protein [Burkholderia sp. LMG 21824]|uniref:hypothetical protein n=1 Tax=Burkholderia sp. LMG 21824 TaxID=3158172 RepID=UPI003C2D59C2